MPELLKQKGYIALFRIVSTRTTLRYEKWCDTQFTFSCLVVVIKVYSVFGIIFHRKHHT